MGAGISTIALIFAGSTSIPCLLTINPSSFPEVAPNTHLAGLSRSRYLRSLSKKLYQIDDVAFCVERLGDHIVYVDFYLPVHHIMEQCGHGPLAKNPSFT